LNVLLATGYTGVAVVLLTAAAYSWRISLDPGASQPALTLIFLAINVLAAWLGGRIYAERPHSPFGIALLVLSDVIFPLNLYAPLVLYMPGLKGRVFESAFVVLVLGVLYHLRGYWNLPHSRFHPVFYPYFFAGAGAGLLHLSRFTAGLSLSSVLWLSLAFGLGLHALALRRRLEPRTQFPLAVAAVFFGTAAFGAWDLWQKPALGPLALLFVAGALVLGFAWVNRGLGPLARVIGLLGWASLTLAFTGSLYFAGAPPVAYLAATVAWVVTLAVLGIVLDRDWADPLRDSAYWLSVALALGLAGATAPLWLRQIGLGSGEYEGFLAGIPPVSVPLALVGAAGALFAQGFWRHRHPSIASTAAGFVASVGFLNVASYAAPLLLVPATSALFAVLGPGGPGLVWAPFAFGVAYLTLAERADRLYPMGAMDLAGPAALLLAGVAALQDKALASVILASGALLFLWRALRARSLWPHLGFLVLITAAAVTLGPLLPAARTAPLAGAFVAMLFLVRTLARHETPRAALLLALAWAVLGGAAVLVLETVWGERSLVTFEVVWLGFLIGLWARAPLDGEPEPESALRTLGYGVAHAAGGLWLVYGLRALGTPVGFEAIALAAWAWGHQVALRRGVGSARDRALAVATRHAVHVFALVSVVLAVALAGPGTRVACALVYAVLCFLIASDAPRGSKALLRGGYALTLLAIGLGIASGLDAALLALGGGALVFLWRSLREVSLVPHLVFLLLGTAAAVLAATTHGQDGGMLPLALLAAALAFAARALRTVEGNNAKVRLTLSWALLAGTAAALVELALPPHRSFVFLVLWLGLLLGLSRYDRRSGTERRAARREVADRRQAPLSEDDWLPVGGLFLAHASGAAFLWYLLAGEGLPAAARGAVLAAWAWLHLTALIARHANASAHPATVATRQAVHLFTVTALAVAAFRFRDGVWPVAVCAIVGTLYLFWRWWEPRPLFQHASAFAYVQGLVILGVARGIPWVEYYLTPIGLYLCLLLYLGRAARERESRPALQPRRPPRFLGDRGDVLALLAVLLMVAYPFWATLRSPQAVHLFFLGGASVLLLHVLLTTGRPAGLVYLVCGLFVSGTSYGVAFGAPAPRLWLFLVLTGALAIASLVRAAPPEGRLAGEKGRT